MNGMSITHYKQTNNVPSVGHSMGALQGALQMIPTGVRFSEAITSIHYRRDTRVSVEALEAEIQVHITLYGNFLAGTHGFTCFL